MNVISPRKRIGLQIQRMGIGFAARLWPGAVACAEARGVDLIMFPGHTLDSPYGFEYQFNSIYKLMNENTIDALVVYSSLMGNFVDLQRVQDFLGGIKNIPIVSVAGNVPGIPSIVIDNKSGIKELVRHFVHEHQARRIAFVKGPESNLESEERFIAYREEMHAQNLLVEPNLTVQGDFSWFCIPTVIDELLAKCGELPDAIMFANDEMALRGATYLQEKGFSLPDQIAICGFDDLSESSFSTPQLTTVRQPFYEMSWKGVETALDMLEEKPVEDITTLVPTVVIRTSCGCSLQSINPFYHTAQKARSVSVITNEARSINDYVVSLLSDKYLMNREKNIFTIIQKILALEEIPLNKDLMQSNRRKIAEFFQKVLEAELVLKMQIKDWQHILIIISESLNAVNQPLKHNQDIQLTIRFCSLLIAELSEIRQSSLKNYSDTVQNVLREVLIHLSSIVQMDDLIEALHSNIPLLDIKTFYLFIYENPWIHERKTEFVFPETINYVTGMIDQEVYNVEENANVFKALSPVPKELFSQGNRRTVLMYPLFFRETQYGVIILELSKATGFVIDSLISAISSVIKSIYVYEAKEKSEEKLRMMMIELEEYNTQLNNLSITDDLTSLYNRRGFMKLAGNQHRLNIKLKKKSLMIFIDIDGLKKVNDLHGHEEGDWVIMMTGEVLRKAFRDMDIIARLGGDEFTVFIPNSGIEKLSVFKRRMNTQIKTVNKDSEKPFKLSMSIGAVECSFRDEKPIEYYMKRADEKLYKEKRRKKEAREK
ncbi:MAG TPA: GGDEF domain-containing protein [Treponema sp.]|nr:GGDEF domain-containing protein [Treponema sp.]